MRQKPFHYKIKTLEGSPQKGVIIAASPEEAVSFLQDSSRVVVSLKPSHWWQQRFLKDPELCAFFRDLTHLCKAGLPILEALQSLTIVPLYPLRMQLQQGVLLSEAFTRTGLITDSLVLAFIRNAERHGDYPKAFEQIIAHLAWRIQFKERFVKALTYPLFVLLLSGGLISFLLSYVVPKLVTLYQTTGQALPAATSVLLTLSDVSPVLLGLLMGGALVLGLLYGIQKRYASLVPAWSVKVCTLFLRIPWFGPRLQEIILLQYFEGLQVLLASGACPILQALDQTRENIKPRLFQTLFQGTSSRVAQGLSLTQSLQCTGLLPDAVTQMLFVGETSGRLPQNLQGIMSYLNDHFSNATEVFLKRIGPLLLLMVGGLLLFIVVSIFLPLYGGLGALE
jgi:type II secretory pathway component PulF